MSARRLPLLPLLLLAVAGPARATDAPHDLSSSPAISCDSCHTLHVGGVGGNITNVVGNYNLCKSCHDSRGPTFAWPADYQAVPGGQGRSHRWDAPAVNAARGASLPVDPGVLGHLSNGGLQCSTCHDQHLGASTRGGTQRTSVPAGLPVARTAGSGTGTLVLNQPAPAAAPKGYRVEVVVAGAVGTSHFRVSNDNGVSWFGWTGTSWLEGETAGHPTGAQVALNDGGNVTVSFSGTFEVGDRWNFYVSYPFLRMSMTASELCETCHSSRVQSAAYVESGGDGVKVFSHPVGETLAKSYDRSPATILDANGQPQSTGDGLATNNLQLDPTNRVRCLTCHGIHNVDSNSLTEDAR